MRNQIGSILILFTILLVEVLIIYFICYKIHMTQHADRVEKQEIDTFAKYIRQDMRFFPISKKYRDKVFFEDSYGACRGTGEHEGCDVMYDENIAGVVPIISATDGIITNLGWLHLGGYRVGITSYNDIYYYYAHFDSCAPGLFVGKEVKAGEFLGFMGNTGEGEEGTKGKFPVHLHFGIYVGNQKGDETTVNPYQYLLEINEE